MEQSLTGAEQVTWDLTDLYTDREHLERDLKTGLSEAESFSNTYKGTVDKLDAEGLAKALKDYERIQDRLGRSFTYVYLNWTTRTEDAEAGALLQHVRESYTEASKWLIFFELEWAKLEDERAEYLLAQPALAPFKHYLELQRLQRKHLLTEPEEKILADKSVTGISAWNRFFDETIASMRFDLDGQTLTEQEVLSRLHETDREIRRKAALSLTEGLKEKRRELAFIFNTILADKASTDRLRKYPGWLSSRNLSNEVSDEVVEALIAAVTERYDLVARYYHLKKKLLGVDEFMDYDRYAPIGEAGTRYTWDEARMTVLDSYRSFHPVLGGIVEQFFEKRWIDAAVVPGKRGGAFSHGAVPSVHPYIMMNYTAKIRDVQTLAHELGHGVHQYLSREQGVLQADTPLTTAETASVFGEMLVFQRLIQSEQDDRNRLAMLAGKIDDTIATVFRQVAMNRFEDRIHTARREQGELSPDQFGEVWLETQKAMFQGSVTLGEHYRVWWSYIPHFLHSPGYVYAYAFGELLVLALYARYLEAPATFPERYIDLLRAGGSDWPHVLVSRLGIDLTDLDFWKLGLNAIEDLIVQAEQLAEKLEVGSPT